MKNVDVIRAWKDQEYHDSLTQEQRAALPANPAGTLSEAEAASIAGGSCQGDTCSYQVCPPITAFLTGGAGCDECEQE